MSSKIKLCDLKTGSSTHILKGHKDAIISVQWSNKEEFLLASGRCVHLFGNGIGRGGGEKEGIISLMARQILKVESY